MSWNKLGKLIVAVSLSHHKSNPEGKNLKYKKLHQEITSSIFSYIKCKISKPAFLINLHFLYLCTWLQ